MATYVLVHGAWGGSWGWKQVARGLRAARHEAYAPSLTGLGERVHLAHPGITLSTHIADVTNAILFEDLNEVILVGHSYGGMVISGVAGAMAGRISALVYVDAFLPEDGQALWDIADERMRASYIDGQRETPGLIAPLFAAEGGRANALTAHPLLTLTEPVRIGEEAAAIRQRTYVYATRNAPTSFTRFHDRVKDDPAWRVHEIGTGHFVMGEDPEGLTRLLLEEARASGAAG